MNPLTLLLASLLVGACAFVLFFILFMTFWMWKFDYVSRNLPQHVHELTEVEQDALYIQLHWSIALAVIWGCLFFIWGLQ